MREITVKYSGECHKCGAVLEVGTAAVYEKRIGIFCVPCGPSDSEEIRELRQEEGERRAERYDTWAENREQAAHATLDRNRERYWDDWAFVTQPGHIPIRSRVIAQEDKAHESLQKAREMRGKAESLRHVRVKGDAEKKHQDYRDFISQRISVGSRVESVFFGPGTVEKVFKKSLRVKFDRGFTNTSDKGHFTIP